MYTKCCKVVEKMITGVSMNYKILLLSGFVFPHLLMITLSTYLLCVFEKPKLHALFNQIRTEVVPDWYKYKNHCIIKINKH